MMKNVERIKNLPCPERAPYCVIIVKNISRNMRRSHRNHIDIDELASTLTDDTYSNPEQEFFSRFDIEYLGQLISDMAVQDQEVILMKWGKQMGYREIGIALGISEDAAMKRGQRALKRLKESYSEVLK